METVYKYDNYREFLSDYYEEQKATDAGFSYQKFSRLAGLNSPNYLKLVLDGTRNLTVANIQQFAKAIGLTFGETQFFEALVLHGQAKTDLELKYYKTRLQKLRRQAVTLPTRKIRIAELIATHYYPAIVVCLDGLPPDSALKEIECKTGIRPEQSELVIAALKKNGLLIEREGVYRLSDDFLLMHDKKMTDAAHKNYLRAQLLNSQKIFDKRYEKDAKFYSYTFTAAANSLPYYTDRLQQFAASLIEHANTEPADKVMQFNLQLFPFV